MSTETQQNGMTDGEQRLPLDEDGETMFETIFGVMAVTLFVMAFLIIYKNLKPVVMTRV